MSRRKELAGMLRAVALGEDIEPELFCSILTEVADLLDPPADENTIEVRVLVRVDFHDGESGLAIYNSAGCSKPGGGHASEEFLRDHVDDQVSNAGSWTENGRWTWITARVPKPAPVVEVEGMMDP